MPRFGTALSIIFATIAYQLVFLNKLPNLAYLTLLDQYAVALLVFIFTVLLHVFASHGLALPTFERHGAQVLAALFFAAHGVGAVGVLRTLARAQAAPAGPALKKPAIGEPRI